MDPKRAFSKATVGIPLHVNPETCTPMLELTCSRGFATELRSEGRVHESSVLLQLTCKRRKSRMNYKVDFVLDGKMLVELKGCPAPAPKSE